MAQPELTLCEFLETDVPRVESFSPFCLKVRRALRVAGLSFSSRRAADPGEFRALNPTGQLPVLLVDGVPIADSTRILARIEELVPGRIAGDPDPRVRAEALLWEELADTALNGFLVAARWADARNWPSLRDAYFGRAPWFVRSMIVPRIRSRVVSSLIARDVWRAGPEACWQRFGLTLDQLEARAPEGGHWVGRRLSAADLGIFAQLHSLRTPLTPYQSGELAKRTALSAYLDRIDVETSSDPGDEPTTGAKAKIDRLGKGCEAIPCEM